MSNMILYLGSLTLPKYSTLVEPIKPNAAEVEPLDGSLSVDFINYRRRWVIGWEFLSNADYQSIMTQYKLQFSSSQMLWFGIPALGINVPVYIKISDSNYKWNGNYIQNFSITLEEGYAVS